jgi:hypothetical protein
MLFLDVVSCEQARTDITQVLSDMDVQITQRLRYISLYDLYGRHDVLFRFAGPDQTAATDIKKQVTSAIERSQDNSRARAVASQLLNVKDVEYIEPQAGHTVWTQDMYEKRRMERAFLVATRVDGKEVLDGDWRSACEKIRHALETGEQFPLQYTSASWSVHRAEKAFVVEGLLGCGRYYDLRVVTRALEAQFLDHIAWTKPNFFGRTNLTYW